MGQIFKLAYFDPNRSRLVSNGSQVVQQCPTCFKRVPIGRHVKHSTICIVLKLLIFFFLLFLKSWRKKNICIVRNYIPFFVFHKVAAQALVLFYLCSFINIWNHKNIPKKGPMTTLTLSCNMAMTTSYHCLICHCLSSGICILGFSTINQFKFWISAPSPSSSATSDSF